MFFNQKLILIISCEHATNHIPEEYRHIFFDDREILTKHFAYDIGAITVAKHCAKLASFACYANISRLLIDLNRSLHHKAIFSRFSKRLTAKERDDLQQNYYLPYRENLQKHIEAYIAKGMQVLHISVHSFTPIWHDELRLVDIGLLYDPKRKTELSFATHWQKHLRLLAPTWRIRKNAPYRGISDGLTTTLRKIFTDSDYLGFELEMNQAMFDDPLASQNLAMIISQSITNTMNDNTH